MTYYAADDSNVRLLVAELTRAIRATTRDSRWFALVDMAFDHDRAPVGRRASGESIYTGRLEALSPFAPTLLQLATGSHAELETQLAELLKHASGRPMLSFICSKQQSSEIAEHLRNFAEVYTNEGESFLLRFADTRVLPSLQESLEPPNWANFTAPLDAWIAINRRAHLQHLATPRESQYIWSDSSRKIAVSDAEISNLLRKSEPDAIIQTLAENFPELLPSQRRADFHDLISDVCEFARQYHLERYPQVASLAVAVAITEGRLLKWPELGRVIQECRQSGGILEEVLGAAIEATENA